MSTVKKKRRPIPLFIILFAALIYFLYPTIKRTFVPETIQETVYSTYGKAIGITQRGVFRVEDVNPDYSKTVWYRTDMDESKTHVEQLGVNLFSYPKLKSLFSNKEIDSVLFVYCYNLAGNDSYDKVFMGVIKREDFMKIDSSSYSSVSFVKFVKILYADANIFQALQSYITK